MKWFLLMKAWFRREILRRRADRWDHQYATGRWEGLKAPLEQARFDTCIALLRRHAAGGDLLEIGCGEGLLLQRLSPDDYGEFVGVDISVIAIDQAKLLATNRATFLVADMQRLEIDRKFDAVVFTESIYYVSHRDELLRRYARFLREHGVFVISVFRNSSSQGVWDQIHVAAAPIERATTTNAAGTWDCEVLRLR